MSLCTVAGWYLTQHDKARGGTGRDGKDGKGREGTGRDGRGSLAPAASAWVHTAATGPGRGSRRRARPLPAAFSPPLCPAHVGLPKRARPAAASVTGGADRAATAAGAVPRTRPTRRPRCDWPNLTHPAALSLLVGRSLWAASGGE